MTDSFANRSYTNCSITKRYLQVATHFCLHTPADELTKNQRGSTISIARYYTSQVGESLYIFCFLVQRLLAAVLSAG